MKKLTILIIASVLYPMLSFGQTNTVTLVASGDGTSKTEAESMALRSAIEQAFGTFVSANTTILNDDIVKDEIATISSGNIESYNIVAESETDGRWYISVKAVVSINKLVDYAKSRGSSTEFAGQNFAMQMKMRKLNKENEEKALSDLLAEVELISSTTSLFDYSINQGEPQFVSDSEYKVPITVSAKWNQNGKNAIALISRTFSSLSLSSSDQESYKSNNYPLVSCNPLGKITDDETKYVLRSDVVNSIIEQLRVCFHKNLHCFSIVRKGKGEEYKTSLCPIFNKHSAEPFGYSTTHKYTLIPTLSEKVLYETEGFEVVPDPTLSIISKPQMVDLGLSVKWADINLGVSPIYPLGYAYAWGEVNERILNTGDPRDTYVWTWRTPNVGIRYDKKYNKEDSKKVLELDDDVAHVKLGGKWRMPTREEWEELRDNCKREWITLNGMKGIKFTSKKNGNSIFLPATDTDEGSFGRYGWYWTSSLYSGFSVADDAYYIYFNSGYTEIQHNKRHKRYYIRPVSE